MKWVAVMIVLLALPVAGAGAHVERASYWPDPAADVSVQPPAGGAVPKERSLSSALRSLPAGRTRVVCQKQSLRRVRRAIATARENGYDVRPTDHRRLSGRLARTMMRINRRLRKRCRFSEIQPAVTASHNNDRVVVMPGLYTEPTSRAQPTHDPTCAQYAVTNDLGDLGALSYAYQLHCPNDQNLIAVIGRDLGPGSDPDPALPDRHGIPNLGPCIRCNLQLEGSGVSADDVVVEAGDPAAGDGGPSGAGHQKDVGIRVDRADGFVLRNVTVRHATEHGIYVTESDGYMLDRFKTFFNGAYGVLTFVEDHGVVQNCEASGHGDSGIYPGAPAETGAQRAAGTEFRYNQEVRYCDAHHNLAGYSATNGNAVWIHHNNFYDNSLGSNTDVVTAAGHPGFPGDSELFEDNNYYSNNFNSYAPGSDVEPIFPYPIGTGAWIAGGNNHTLRGNRFYDNWRRGVMLFSVPDVLLCGPVIGVPIDGCSAAKFSTSYENRFYANVMGVAPNDTRAANGVDFWWDAFPGSRGNCWYQNRGPSAITSSPRSLPSCANGSDPGSSVGTGDVVNEAEMLTCLVAFTSGSSRPALCPWFTVPPKPGSRGARRARGASALMAGAERVLGDFCGVTGINNPTCSPFAERLRAAGVRLHPAIAALQAASPRSRTPAGALVSAVPGSHTLLSLFTCQDWNRANANARTAVLRRLAGFTSGHVVANGVDGTGTALTEQQATTFFDQRCNSGLPGSVALYKMYGYATGFAGSSGP
jgi:hypothetical protein